MFTQDGQGVLDGGEETDWRYGGKLETFWKLDLDRMGVLPGAFVNMTSESRYGRSANGIAGTLLPVDDVLFFPLTDEPDEDVPITITELRYTQFLSQHLGLFLGKFVPLGADANEFAGGRGDTQLLSHPFLTASVTSLINPYSTLGGGRVVRPDERTTISSSLFSSGDSSTTSGFDELDEGRVSSTSVQTQYRLGELPGGMMLTGQYGFDNDLTDFDGQFVDSDGAITIPLVDDTWNAFWNGWQYLHVDDASEKAIDVANGRTDRQGYGLFARAGVADRDTNPVQWVASGGVGGRGVASREQDSYGIGFLYAEVHDAPFVTSLVLEDSARRAEAYYTIALAPGAELTVDLQYADSIRADLDPATLLGFRLRLQF